MRATIYLTPDGQVHFGALFEELLPVAKALDPAFEIGGACELPPREGRTASAATAAEAEKKVEAGSRQAPSDKTAAGTTGSDSGGDESAP